MNELAIEDMLNPALDAKALSEEFEAMSRIRINDVLRPEFAEQAARCMEGDQVPWEMTVGDNWLKAMCRVLTR